MDAVLTVEVADGVDLDVGSHTRMRRGLRTALDAGLRVLTRSESPFCEVRALTGSSLRARQHRDPTYALECSFLVDLSNLPYVERLCHLRLFFIMNL